MDTHHKKKVWNEIRETLNTDEHIEILYLILYSYILYFVILHYTEPTSELKKAVNVSLT